MSVWPKGASRPTRKRETRGASTERAVLEVLRSFVGYYPRVNPGPQTNTKSRFLATSSFTTIL